MHRIAATLAALDLGLDAIVTSPLVRAKQTAEIVAQALEMPLKEEARLAPGFNPVAAACRPARPPRRQGHHGRGA
jgi:phosphohistidine phosphatase SixA